MWKHPHIVYITNKFKSGDLCQCGHDKNMHSENGSCGAFETDVSESLDALFSGKSPLKFPCWCSIGKFKPANISDYMVTGTNLIPHAIRSETRKSYMASYEMGRFNPGDPVLIETYVYHLFTDDKELLYIGVSSNPKERMKEHKREKDWFREVSCYTERLFESRDLALEIERDEIKMFSPKYNIVHNGETVGVIRRVSVR